MIPLKFKLLLQVIPNTRAALKPHWEGLYFGNRSCGLRAEDHSEEPLTINKRYQLSRPMICAIKGMETSNWYIFPVYVYIYIPFHSGACQSSNSTGIILNITRIQLSLNQSHTSETYLWRWFPCSFFCWKKTLTGFARIWAGHKQALRDNAESGMERVFAGDCNS